MQTEDVLTIDRSTPGLAVLTLNRPKKMNALSLALRKALIRELDRLDTEGQVSVVILTGAGKAFCAGLDLQEISEDSASLTSAADLSPIAAIRRFSGIVIGAINGPAVTGGLELALACDILIASTEARFADTHLRVGAMPGWHLSQRLSRTIGVYRAKHMTMTGQYISAERAERWGLVSDLFPPADLIEGARALGESLLAMPAQGLRDHKRLIDDGYAVTFAEGLEIEAQRASQHNNAVTGDDIAMRRSAIQRHGTAQNATDYRA